MQSVMIFVSSSFFGSTTFVYDLSGVASLLELRDLAIGEFESIKNLVRK